MKTVVPSGTLYSLCSDVVSKLSSTKSDMGTNGQPLLDETRVIFFLIRFLSGPPLWRRSSQAMLSSRSSLEPRRGFDLSSSGSTKKGISNEFDNWAALKLTHMRMFPHAASSVKN